MNYYAVALLRSLGDYANAKGGAYRVVGLTAVEWLGGAEVGDTLVQVVARWTGNRGGPGAWGVGC